MSRQRDLGWEAEKLVKEAGGDATFVETDVTDEDSVRHAIQATVARYGKLDVLYNCAGGSIPDDGPVTDVDMSVWQHTQSLDLLGTFLCCRHGIPEIIKTGGGSVINMSSMAAVRPGSMRRHVYVAAKGAIITFTQAIAGEYARHRVRANAICPHGIITGRARDHFAKEGTSDVREVPAIRIAGSILYVDGGSDLVTAHVGPGSHAGSDTNWGVAGHFGACVGPR